MDESESAKRGTKRKRVDSGTRIAGKLHHDLKEVRKAAKKAKTFETQKLVKKLKLLRTKTNHEGETKDLEAQLDFLKHTDHERIANTALKTKLNKDRMLSENSDIQAAISIEIASSLVDPTIPSTMPAAKVQNRLLSSKILALEITRVVEDLKGLLRPQKKVDLPDRGQVTGGGIPARPMISKRSSSDSDTEEDDNSIDSAYGVGNKEEPDDSAWESGDIDDDASGDDSNDVQEDGDHETADHPVDSSTRVAQSKQEITQARSTFLPSLAVGFTRGDPDDSEWSEGELRQMEGTFKKNRRGQRARRAIWEKKYGRNANHKKKEREEMSDRSRQPSMNHRNRPTGNIPLPPDRNQDRMKPLRVDSTLSNNDQSRRSEDKPLHPSWEAKKRLKEKNKIGILPSQGTKIKF